MTTLVSVFCDFNVHRSMERAQWSTTGLNGFQWTHVETDDCIAVTAYTARQQCHLIQSWPELSDHGGGGGERESRTLQLTAPLPNEHWCVAFGECFWLGLWFQSGVRAPGYWTNACAAATTLRLWLFCSPFSKMSDWSLLKPSKELRLYICSSIYARITDQNDLWLQRKKKLKLKCIT